MWEKSAAREVLRESPGMGVCALEAGVGGVGGGLERTVFLSKRGSASSILTFHFVYMSSSYCFIERATVR